MAFFRKIKAGLVKDDIENFVGEEGNLFFNIETGELRLSDGQSPGGISIGGGGGGGTPLTVSLYQDGVLEPTEGTVRWYSPSSIRITNITARLATSSQNTVTIRVKKNQTIVQTINFSANQEKSTASANIPMILDDYLTVDVVTTGGSGLSVSFTYNFE